MAAMASQTVCNAAACESFRTLDMKFAERFRSRDEGAGWRFFLMDREGVFRFFILCVGFESTPERRIRPIQVVS
jgi:hypothetical protein